MAVESTTLLFQVRKKKKKKRIMLNNGNHLKIVGGRQTEVTKQLSLCKIIMMTSEERFTSF